MTTPLEDRPADRGAPDRPAEQAPAGTVTPEDSGSGGSDADPAPRAEAGSRLGDLLEPVFADEPALGDAVDAVLRRAGRLRRRRSRLVLAAAVVGAVLVIAFGYVLTTVLLPVEPARTPAAPAPAPTPPDRVRAVLAAALQPSGLRVVPRGPAAGAGWRQYLVLNRYGRPHGLIEVSVYAAPGRLCFPVLADQAACARPQLAGGVQYVRYGFDQDVDWQVNEVIARRLADGRTVAVQATGERGTGAAAAGRPPLTALLAAAVAVDPRTAAAFGPSERCNGPDPACPVLRVPVPVN